MEGRRRDGGGMVRWIEGASVPGEVVVQGKIIDGTEAPMP